jgi:hypothetical protein
MHGALVTHHSRLAGTHTRSPQVPSLPRGAGRGIGGACLSSCHMNTLSLPLNDYFLTHLAGCAYWMLFRRQNLRYAGVTHENGRHVSARSRNAMYCVKAIE